MIIQISSFDLIFENGFLQQQKTLIFYNFLQLSSFQLDDITAVLQNLQFHLPHFQQF